MKPQPAPGSPPQETGLTFHSLHAGTFPRTPPAAQGLSLPDGAETRTAPAAPPAIHSGVRTRGAWRDPCSTIPKRPNYATRTRAARAPVSEDGRQEAPSPPVRPHLPEDSNRIWGPRDDCDQQEAGTVPAGDRRRTEGRRRQRTWPRDELGGPGCQRSERTFLDLPAQLLAERSHE